MIQQTPPTAVPTITVTALRELLERGSPVTVLDIRPAAERAEWAIPGSRHVDAYQALRAGDPNALTALELPADRPVVTVCAAGQTSLRAAEQLRARGIAASSLAGGMKAWSLAWNSATVALPESRTTVVQVRRTGKGCLSYLVGARSEAAVIDPALDPAVYQDLAQRHDWTIVAVLDTHVHADHLSRARRLATATGARLYLPANDRVAYPVHSLNEGTRLTVGGATLTTLLTPGHTRESACYLLEDGALFTGDTLFLAAVGRPDLEADVVEARARAYALYDSLRRLFTLPPTTLVLPGHTSAPVPFDGLAHAASLASVQQALPLLERDAATFVAWTLERLPPTPPNHHRIVELNEAGRLPAGDVTDLEAGANRCAIA